MGGFIIENPEASKTPPVAETLIIRLIYESVSPLANISNLLYLRG